ncbi:PD-(D/E)XK motif protein [Shewanella frigidimarina]|uniref:PD-(D/E)XK motif protein n=1 Tax=Shewanella frigidimarina TaxID=56812 RepID=UPI003D799EE8
MELSDKWKLLESQNIDSGLSTIRFESDGPLEVFLAVDEKSSHAILIYLPSTFIPKFDGINNDNLELTFVKKGHYLQIKLLDSDFTSLFDDLIISLIDSIKNTANAEDASKEFITSYIKWSTFFTKTLNKKLSKERVIGLWGELSYLLKLIQVACSSVPIDNILKSWVGPFGATHDFEFSSSSIEVKTKPLTSWMIRISSEYQLENIDQKPLNLEVISVIESEHGLSLKDLFLKVKRHINKKSGDVTILLSALEKENLSEERLSKYSSFLFARKRTETFNCDVEHFPKIKASGLHKAISTVKYNLDVRELQEFRVSQESY